MDKKKTQLRHCPTQVAWRAKLSPFGLVRPSRETSQLQKQSAGASSQERERGHGEGGETGVR